MATFDAAYAKIRERYQKKLDEKIKELEDEEYRNDCHGIWELNQQIDEDKLKSTRIKAANIGAVIGAAFVFFLNFKDGFNLFDFSGMITKIITPVFTGGLFWVLTYVIAATVLSIRKASVKKQISDMKRRNESNSLGTKEKIYKVTQDINAERTIEFERYKKEVAETAQKAIDNPEPLDDMVKHSVMMLERMIAHADHSSSQKFIKAELTFTVDKKGIQYIYPHSGYNNDDDHYVFFDHHFKDLFWDVECAGLAMALDELVKKTMREKLGENTFKITSRQADAKIDMAFEQINPAFESFKSIF